MCRKKHISQENEITEYRTIICRRGQKIPAVFIPSSREENVSQSFRHILDHAIHSAEIFSQCNPMLVGTGGLVLFPGTSLLDEAEKCEFTPLSEKDMLVELKMFVKHLTCDCTFITHHTVSGKNLTGPDFLSRKDRIVAALEDEITHGDMDQLAAIRRTKRTL